MNDEPNPAIAQFSRSPLAPLSGLVGIVLINLTDGLVWGLGGLLCVVGGLSIMYRWYLKSPENTTENP